MTSYNIINYGHCMDMIPVNQDDYDVISDKVRTFCAERFYQLEKTLRPMVDGTFGEVLPGHLTAYVNVIKELARLYEAHKRPYDLSQMIPASKVQELMLRTEEHWNRRLDEAVAAAEERVRRELVSGEQKTIESAKSTVLARLNDLEKRG